MSLSLSVTHGIVTSHLDYCNVLCIGLPLKGIQTAAICGCMGAHIIPLLHELHWLPVQFVAFKTLHNVGPVYLKDHLFPVVSTHPVQFGRLGMSQIPSVKEYLLG